MIFSELLEPLKINYGVENMPFLQKMLVKVSEEKTYRGLKILHNIPLCLNTLLKIEPLIVGGAEVIITNPHFFTPDRKTLSLLKTADISVELDHHKIADDFDYVLDAAGDFKSLITPRRGAAELTQSGVAIYSDPALRYPILNIDNSSIKTLEACLGTGEGLIRGLDFFVGDVFHHKAFVLFGYGKVGRGAAKQLAKYTQQIVVIDSDDHACERATRDGFFTLHSSDKIAIDRAVKSAYATITATGFKNLVSNSYDPAHFKNKLLVNIGVDDEYGPAFKNNEVLNGKRGVNFALQDPTLLKYMDPVFYAHNFAIDLLETRHFEPGIHAFPKDIDESIMTQWQEIFHENT